MFQLPWPSLTDIKKEFLMVELKLKSVRRDVWKIRGLFLESGNHSIGGQSFLLKNIEREGKRNDCFLKILERGDLLEVALKD